MLEDLASNNERGSSKMRSKFHSHGLTLPECLVMLNIHVIKCIINPKNSFRGFLAETLRKDDPVYNWPNRDVQCAGGDGDFLASIRIAAGLHYLSSIQVNIRYI